LVKKSTAFLDTASDKGYHTDMNDTIYAVLERGFSAAIRDSLWGHIYLTPGMEGLTKSAPFMRLHRIFQLGPAYCVYPGATHTRGAHGIGVYHLARRLLKNFAEQGADEWMTPVGVRSFLAAALLHDLGHFPYAHSLKELPLLKHEALTAAVIITEPVKSLVAAAGADPYMTAGIIDVQLPGGADQELRFYRKLLSGVLDPDKLDYLNRDARYCGVPYGVQDVDFILSRLRPHRERGIDIDSRAIPSAESLLFSKYLMYRTVYWHPGVRAASAMIKKALLGGLKNRRITQEELYTMDDQSLFHWMAQAKDPLCALGDMVRDGRLYIPGAEFPYVDRLHHNLLELDERSRYEEALAEKFSVLFGHPIGPESVIIDIPEPVSFEIDLYVPDEGCYFEQSSGVFKVETVQGFIASLHRVRIFVDPTYKNLFYTENGERRPLDILHSVQQWV
jgi:HD superfamily phosphohydrolase